MSMSIIGRTMGLIAAGVVVLGTSAAAVHGARATDVPSFTRDVAPILYKNCVSCQ